MKHVYQVLALPIFLFISGCNVYSGIDTPSGDAQILDKANTCLDANDFACATKWFKMLSPAQSDQEYFSLSIIALDQAGITTSSFIVDASTNTSNAGAFLNGLVSAIYANQIGATSRLTLFHAYQNYLKINNPSLQAFTRFLTSAALFSEILAEAATTPGTLKTSDLVNDAVNCPNASQLQLLTPNGVCSKPSASNLNDGTGTPINLPTTTDAIMGIPNPNLDMVLAAVQEINTAATQLNVSAGVGAATQSFSSELSALGGALNLGAAAAAFRQKLISQGIGSK